MRSQSAPTTVTSSTPNMSVRVMGCDRSGKSCFLFRFKYEVFTPQPMSVDNKVKSLQLNDETHVNIKLHDHINLRDNELTRQLKGFHEPSLSSKAEVTLITVDLTDPKALEKTVVFLNTQVNEFQSNPILILVGTKSDGHRAISVKQMQAFVIANQMNGYIETSARNDINIDQTFKMAYELHFEYLKKSLQYAREIIAERRQTLLLQKQGLIPTSADSESASKPIPRIIPQLDEQLYKHLTLFRLPLTRTLTDDDQSPTIKP